MAMKMKSSRNRPKAWRIGVVTFLRQMDAQQGLDGMYRAGEGVPNLQIRLFDEEVDDFRGKVIEPLSEWKPHGLIVRMSDFERLRTLREHFARLPFVSTVVAPPGLSEVWVVGNLVDTLSTCRDYFHRCGLSNIALFCIYTELAESNVIAGFRRLVPDGSELLLPQKLVDARSPAERRKRRKIMTDGLRGLPKPVGIMTCESTSAPFGLQWCHRLNLRVPEDVQIIGTDAEDLCFGCEPRLTSYVPPNRSIGEEALKTMIRLLRGEQPPPIVRVSGGAIFPRGSTALRDVGHRAVAGAIDRMQAHADRGLTAGDVTRLSKVGRNTFYKQFGAVTGDTPGRYLRKMRIEKACRMLQETDDTVTAIGKECGFKSLESFVNFFRRQTGQTPSVYRQKTRESGKAR